MKPKQRLYQDKQTKNKGEKRELEQTCKRNSCFYLLSSGWLEGEGAI